jgi:hypothetical protein
MLFGSAALAGCTVHQTAPGVYAPVPPSKFDRSWSSVIGAFEDQGVSIKYEDRSAGRISGARNGITLDAGIHSQADGSVRVEFNTSGTTARDPGLIDRVTQSYNYHMGR